MIAVVKTGNLPVPCSGGMGTCGFPVRKVLADTAAFGHICS
jgi:hypothetical protein